METFSELMAICVGNSPVTGEFPTQRPVTRSFGVFFDLRLNKLLSKQWWSWWFETPSRPLWRHCYGSFSHNIQPVPLFTERTDVLPQDLVKCGSHEIGCHNDRCALEFLYSSWQGRCQGACQISERLEKSKPGSRDFETLRDLAVRRPSA